MGLLINLLIVLVIGIVGFLLVKYGLDQAEVDPPIRKIVLLICLIFFLVMVFNVMTGYAMWPAFYQPGHTVVLS